MAKRRHLRAYLLGVSSSAGGSSLAVSGSAVFTRTISLPADLAEPLLERGVLPGCRICPVRSSPGGDPIVSIDGSLLALRRETADCLCVRLLSSLNDPA